MAGRPLKQGLDYFSHSAINDDNINALMQCYGAKGYAVYYSLCEKICNNGYFYEIKDRQIKLLCLNLKITEDEFYNILSLMIELEMFSREIYANFNVLTSSKMQEDYFFATKNRKTTTFFVEYLLLDNNYLLENTDEKRKIRLTPIKVTNNSINVDENTINTAINSINSENCETNSINVDENTHSKVKYSKVNKSNSKEKEKEKEKKERAQEVEREKEKESAESKNHWENNSTLETSTTEKNLQDEEFRAVFSSFSNSKTVNM